MLLVPDELVDVVTNGDLFFRELAVCSIDLSKDIASIDEQNAIVFFAFVEEPQCGRQCHGIKHVRRKGEHAVDQVLFNQCLPNSKST